MRALADYLKKKTVQKNRDLDEKTVFFIFEKIIRREYGQRGIKNIEAQCYRNKTLYVRSLGAVWANEVYLNRKGLANSVNEEIGSNEVREINIKR